MNDEVTDSELMSQFAEMTGRPVLILLDQTTATVTHQTTGETLSHHNIDPDRSYWRNQDKEPGRWPSPQI